MTSEEQQAAIYAELVRYVACDPDVAQLSFFGYYDERNRAGWQSALRRADGSERPANAAVASAIAAGCTSGMRSWSPLAKPEGAGVEFARVNPKAKGHKVVVRYVPTAAEDVTVRAGFVPVGTPAARIPAMLAAAGRVDANRRPPRTATGTVSAARQVLAVVLSATLDPSRSAVFTSEPFKATAGTAKTASKAKPKAAKKHVKKQKQRVKRR